MQHPSDNQQQLLLLQQLPPNSPFPLSQQHKTKTIIIRIQIHESEPPFEQPPNKPIIKPPKINISEENYLHNIFYAGGKKMLQF